MFSRVKFCSRLTFSSFKGHLWRSLITSVMSIQFHSEKHFSMWRVRESAIVVVTHWMNTFCASVGYLFLARGCDASTEETSNVRCTEGEINRWEMHIHAEWVWERSVSAGAYFEPNGSFECTFVRTFAIGGKLIVIYLWIMFKILIRFLCFYAWITICIIMDYRNAINDL